MYVDILSTLTYKIKWQNQLLVCQPLCEVLKSSSVAQSRTKSCVCFLNPWGSFVINDKVLKYRNFYWKKKNKQKHKFPVKHKLCCILLHFCKEKRFIVILYLSRRCLFAGEGYAVKIIYLVVHVLTLSVSM